MFSNTIIKSPPTPRGWCWEGFLLFASFLFFWTVMPIYEYVLNFQPFFVKFDISHTDTLLYKWVPCLGHTTRCCCSLIVLFLSFRMILWLCLTDGFRKEKCKYVSQSRSKVVFICLSIWIDILQNLTLYIFCDLCKSNNYKMGYQVDIFLIWLLFKDLLFVLPLSKLLLKRKFVWYCGHISYVTNKWDCLIDFDIQRFGKIFKMLTSFQFFEYRPKAVVVVIFNKFFNSLLNMCVFVCMA